MMDDFFFVKKSDGFMLLWRIDNGTLETPPTLLFKRYA